LPLLPERRSLLIPLLNAQMLADGASTILEDAELRNAERQAAEGNSWPGGRQGPVSQATGPYGMTLQGSAVRLATQSNAQFTWRGIAEAPAQAGQFNGMGRLPPAMGGVGGGGGGLMEYAGGGGEQAPSSRSSGAPGSHVFATPSWHSMVPDASALARGILRGGEGRPGLGQIGGGSGSGTSWAGTASAHWWAAGVSASPQSRGVVTAGPPGAMFQTPAGMQGYSAAGDVGRFTAGSNGPVSVAESCGNVPASMSSGEGWGNCGPDARGGASGRNKRKRPPSLSCIEAAAVATAAAAACRASGEEGLYFGNTTARRRVEQGEEVDGSGGGNGGGGGNCIGGVNGGGIGGGGGGGGGNSVGSGGGGSGGGGGGGGGSVGNGNTSGSGGNGGGGGTMLLPPLPAGGGLKWGAGGSVVLAPLTPMTPFASGDGWTLPMTPQRTAESWTPTAAGSEALGRGDSWTFSITPRTPRDLTLQVM